MPEKALKKLNTYILPEWKICFFASIIVGLFAHFYKITNWLPNWDSLVFKYDSQNMLAIGRWFLPVVCSFSSFYDLPFLNGVIAIVFHALSAVCICRILNVKEKITATLIGMVLVSFPTVTSVMMYNYVADGYSIALFLSTLAAWYMTKEKPKYILSAILIALSAGIYQAYITVTITLAILFMIDKMVFKNIEIRKILKRAFYMLLTGILGVVIYSIALKICLGVSSIQLRDYQGANDTVSLSNINLLASLYVIKEIFIKFFFDLSNGMSLYTVINCFILTFTFMYYLKTIVVNKIYKKPLSLFMIVVLEIMLILGAGAIAIINPSVDYHNLMLMGYSVLYILFLIIYERGTETKQKAIKCWIVLITTVLLVSNWVVIANVSYHKAQIAYEKSYGVLIRIADRIEQIPNSQNCDKVLVIGALDDSEAYSVNLPPDITGITDGYILRADDEDAGQSVLCSALNDYCNTRYDFVRGEEKKKIMKRNDIKSMGIWPEKDCIAVLDNIVVIKLAKED